MSALSGKKCIPCEGGVAALPLHVRSKLLEELNSDWSLIDNSSKLERKVLFKDFKKPWDLLNKVSQLAEDQWHHPDLSLGWGYLNIKIWTHKIDSLVESDFIFAAKVDKLIND